MSTTLERLAEIERQLEAIRDLETTRAAKLDAIRLATERGLMLANALALLRRIPAANGTVADDVRRQRDLIEKHLRSTAA